MVADPWRGEWPKESEEDEKAEAGEVGGSDPEAAGRTDPLQRVPDETETAGHNSPGTGVSSGLGPAAPGPVWSRSTSSGPTTASEYERRYGVEIQTPGEAATLQRLEETNGLGTVREWAEEEIPIDAMGSKSDMAVFRERKGTPVPWDIERRNEQSKRRNRVVQRMTDPAGETSEVPDELRTALSSPGRKLDQAVRETKEAQFGSNFEHVCFHAGPRATAATEAIDAKACTVGNHILVNDPDFDPQSPRGDYVLTHELAHVEQQTDGTVSRLPTDDAGLQIDPDPQLERAANETARQVLNGESTAGGAGVTTDTGVSVQRMDRGTRPRNRGIWRRILAWFRSCCGQAEPETLPPPPRAVGMTGLPPQPPQEAPPQEVPPQEVPPQPDQPQRPPEHPHRRSRSAGAGLMADTDVLVEQTNTGQLDRGQMRHSALGFQMLRLNRGGNPAFLVMSEYRRWNELLDALLAARERSMAEGRQYRDRRLQDVDRRISDRLFGTARFEAPHRQQGQIVRLRENTADAMIVGESILLLEQNRDRINETRRAIEDRRNRLRPLVQAEALGQVSSLSARNRTRYDNLSRDALHTLVYLRHRNLDTEEEVERAQDTLGIMARANEAVGPPGQGRPRTHIPALIVEHPEEFEPLFQ